MAKQEPTASNPGLEEILAEAFQEMSYVPCDSDEFSKIADQVVKLYPLKEVDSKRRISPDNLALIAGNLVGIGMIVGHERMHVVTSKALSFIMKLR